MSEERRLDLSLLEKALARLEEALRKYRIHPEIESLRDSVVIRFVFTYELLMQVVFRYVELKHRKFTPESEMTRFRIVHRANDLGVLRAEWKQFVAFRDARNGVACTYSEARALRVVELAESLAEEARYLLDRVRESLERLGLKAQDVQIVPDVLADPVPNRPVWAFGSRTFGRAHRYSDLDLAVGGETVLSAAVRLDMIDAFDESMLPVEVDVVDLNDVDVSFRSRIEPDFLLIQEQGEVML